MNDAINIFDGCGKHSSLFKVVGLDEVESVCVLRPRPLHGLGLGWGSGRAPDAKSAREQDVDDVGTDEARCAGN